MTSDAAAREKRFVALTSVIAAVGLTGMKIVVGLTTGSLGILSEAAHSGLDLVAAAMTLWAVRVAAHPPDREHTYGHGKFENLSALFETLLLLGTCVWIVYEAAERLFFRETHVKATVWGFAIMVVSIVIDWSRSRALARVAKKYNSQALEADALHFSTDIWSSSVVIVGLFLVFLSKQIGAPWLEKGDALAALGVAAIVIWISLQLGKKTINDLLDAVPEELHRRVVEAARVPGVLDVRKVRLRRAGPEIFADVTLAVRRDAVLEHAHGVADACEEAVKRALPGTDVVVHVEPIESDREGLLATIRGVAGRHSLGAHGIRVYDEGDRLSIELHLEVQEKLRVREAHEQVTRFEEALRQALPRLGRVVTHIEPAGDASAARAAAPDDEQPVKAALEAMRSERQVSFSPHDLKVQRVDGELAVSFHCALDAEIPIEEAHALTEWLEKDLRTRVPNIGRVVIHVEPKGDQEER